MNAISNFQQQHKKMIKDINQSLLSFTLHLSDSSAVCGAAALRQPAMQRVAIAAQNFTSRAARNTIRLSIAK